ncbi:MAG TPA: DUF2752 domain-containing protein [Thermoanaerobaculia bacterium]|nr:DUF2752 domain-containing protein [Thermoanaerobaculia bacterium]
MHSAGREARRPAALYVLLAALAAAVTAVVYAFDPATARFYPPCVFHALTGLQCPGCGGTRALHQLLHGNIAAAFRLNPMVFAFLAVAPLAAIRPALLLRPWAAWLAVAALLGWGVLRNLPW